MTATQFRSAIAKFGADAKAKLANVGAADRKRNRERPIICGSIREHPT